jgi:hypothetical protein
MEVDPVPGAKLKHASSGAGVDNEHTAESKRQLQVYCEASVVGTDVWAP